MFKEIKSRRLALLVAAALGGGGFLSSAPNVSAADVTIDASNAPSDNVFVPGGGPAIGTAAGYVGGESDISNVADNTLTFNGRTLPYDKFLFGGITFGTGNVTGNKIFVNPATAPLTSSVDAVHGGMASGGGSAENNHVEFNGNNLNSDLGGGTTERTGTGIVRGNTVTLKGGSVQGDIYGGTAWRGANGDVVHNTVKIEGGAITVHGQSVYGGYTDGTGKVSTNHVEVSGGSLYDVYGGVSENGTTGDVTGNTVAISSGMAQDVYGGQARGGSATGNTVTITGGTARDVYGGQASSSSATGNTVTITGGTVRSIDGGRSAQGAATGNTVNLGDGKSDYAGQVNGVINGGSGMAYGADYRTGNTLNVYDNAGAANIRNFAKISFHFNEHVNKTAAMLTLSDAGGTMIGSLSELTVEGAHNHKGTLIKNTHGVAVSDGVNRLAKTEADEYKELILATSADSKQITYEGYAFAHQNTATTVAEGTDKYTWGGRSVLGNATHHNAITVDSGTHKNVYGGWTSGTGTEAADKDSSYHNEVTFDGAGTHADKIYGGYADTNAGKAASNKVTVKNGKVDNDIYGGAAGGTGDAEENTVRIDGAGAEVASIYGGFARDTGNAKKNRVYFGAGTVSFAEWMIGGYVGTGGNAEENTVEVKGGETSMVYGGFSNRSDAWGNILKNRVVIRGGTITDKVYGGAFGGARATGSVTHNTVTVTGGTLKKTVYGGSLEDGSSTGDVAQNEVTVAGGTLEKDVIGGYTRSGGNLTGNIVTVTGGEIQGSVYAAMSQGNTSTIQNNVVNLGDGEHELAAGSGIAKYIYGAFKGDRASYAGNTLNVKASARAKNIVNFNKVNFYFTDTLQPKLTLRDSMGTKLRSLNDITVHGSPHASSGTLIENNTSGGITIRDGVTSVVTTGDTAEMTLSKSGDNKKINYTRLIFKGARAAETDGSDTWGGRSVIGNTTTGNIVAVDSGTYTNVYGGWTSGAGSPADSSKQKNSTLNKITVSGTASVNGTVYGGFTDVSGGSATGNEVTIEKNVHDVVGGKSVGEASGNTVTVGSAAVNSITGGDGATTKDNTVNIDGATVTNKIVGGTQTDGTGNTLNVKGVNTAQNIGGFQKLHFDTTGVTGTMLTLSDGTNKTKVNWNTLTVGGSGYNITLLKNAAGIDFGGTYTDGAVKSGLSADQQSEINVGVSADKKAITYSGYRFTGVAQALVDGTAAYGGISKAGNATHHNAITVHGNYDEVYGGHTSGTSDTAAEKKHSHDNIVTITGGTLGTVYGGYTQIADGTTNDNTVNLGDGTHPLAPNTTVAALYGGNKTAVGNTLNVNTSATVGKIGNFSKVTFKENAVLRLQAAGVKFDLAAVKADFAPTAQEKTLVESDNALELAGGKTFRTDLSADGTKETNIEVRSGNKEIVRYGHTFKDARTATTVGADTWGGRSKAGNTTTGNEIALGSGTYTNVYGGWTSGAGSTADSSKQKDSTLNKVTVSGTASVNGTVYGGFTDVAGGKATGNEVTIEKNVHDVVGGKSVGEASHNTVTVGSAAVNSITGGDGATTKDNTVNIDGATVANKIVGGTQADGTGNTLNVKGVNTAQNIGGFQKLHFDTTGVTGTMLTLNDGMNKTKVNWNTLTVGGSGYNITLLKNTAGIDFGGTYTDGAVKSGLSADRQSEINVGVSADKKAITYSGYRFTGATQALVDGTAAYGGISKAGNATHHNAITVNGNYDAVYGGHTSGTSDTAAQKKHSHDNTVTITGGTLGTVYGGYTQIADGTTNDNTVNLGDGVNPLAPNTTVAALYGGNRTAAGNTLNVNTSARVGTIGKFSTVTFKNASSKLTLTQAGASIDLDTIKAGFAATEREDVLVESANGLTLQGGKTFRTDLSADGTKETNIEARSGNKEIVRYGYTFKDSRTATNVGAETWGGRSKAGNTTTGNEITLSSGTYANVYGGWTSGVGSTADSSKQKDSTLNKVTIGGSAAISGTVYGGLTDVAGGKATGNEVTIEKNVHDVVGGKAAGEASGNTVSVDHAAVNSITGGDGATTKDNTVNIDGATVANKIVGGTQADGTGNTLNVKGVNTARNIGGFQKLHFDTTGATGTMLTLSDGTNKTKVDWSTLTVGGSGYNITLLKNAAGIDFGGTYTDGVVKSGLSADRQSEINVGVSADKKAITYSGYRFTGATQALVDGTAAYGGISKAGNATHHNAITVHGNYDEVYGGHTSGTSDTAVEKKHSHDNTVTITGGTLGTVYGGYTQIADGTTNDNAINLGDGTHPLAPNTTVAALYGGNKTAAGNTLNVNTSATVGTIGNFSTVTFRNASSKLTLTQAGVNIDLDTIKAGFAATEREDVLVENANGLTLQGGKTFRTDLSADGTKETNIEVRSGNKEIVRYGYTFKDARTATTVGAETWGGRSKAGNTTTGNEITLSSGAYTNGYGGWTSGVGSTADSSKQKDSTLNKVTVSGTASVNGTVYGGFTDVSGGSATGNTVTATNNLNADIVGGKAVGEASGNTVSIDHAAVNSVTGGCGAVTNNNRINLRGAKVTGIVTGGTAASGTGNTLAVSYGMKTTEIGDFRGIQNLHFDMEKAPMDGTAHTMLKLTNVGGEKKLSDAHIDLRRDGAAEKLKVGDKITLMENTSGGITFGENLTAKGTDGVTRDYEFAIASVDKTLIATVTKTSLGEQSKSFVETRTGASAFLNDGADFMAGAGLDAAKAEAARAAAAPGGAAYGLWAGMGGGALRHNTGSYVEIKGWNLGVGWARENAVPAGTLTFGPFLEYGRGSYDSYLDDGTHGDGTSSYIGAGVVAELAMRGGIRVDGTLRAGRTKSDYTGLASYDTSNAYYGIQVGAGKDFRVSEAAAVNVYVRYAYTHTAGASAHLSTGETYEFDAVNSHRVRLGTRWTYGDTAHTQIYAGLAWEYEFDGAAHASYQGDRTPSPSLKGGSALLELGYRFAPKSSRVRYDLHLNGWQGKREGITGGVSVKWMF